MTTQYRELSVQLRGDAIGGATEWREIVHAGDHAHSSTTNGQNPQS